MQEVDDWEELQATDGELRNRRMEARFVRWARERGWEPSKRGWPDYFVPQDAGGFCVEVKHPRKRLEIEQAERMAFFAAHGIACFRWDVRGELRDFAARDLAAAGGNLLPTPERRSCAHCARPFVALHPRATYCGTACRVAAFRLRQITL